MKRPILAALCIVPLVGGFAVAAPLATPSDAPTADLPYFNTVGGPDPVEGDQDKTFVLQWMYSAPLASEARFTYATTEERAPSAIAGVDYVPIPPTEVIVPAGQQSGTVSLTIKGDDVPEPSELLTLKFYGFSGGGTGIGGGNEPLYDDVYIGNDDFPPVPLLANDDFATFVVNEGVTVFVGDNDLFDVFNQIRDTVTTVVTPPAHGTLTQIDYGSGIDYFGYAPDPDFAGRDSFRYRVCKSDGVECIEAVAHLQGMLREPVNGQGRAGGVAVDFDDLPAMTGARFVPSSLARGIEVALSTGVDATPEFPWDSRDGMAWTVRTLPATPAGRSREVRLHVESLAPWHTDLDVHVGLDRDGDGAPSADELLCAGFVEESNTPPPCDVPVVVAGLPVRYWVAMHSREPDAKDTGVRIFEIEMDDAESDLAVTGPSTFGRGDAVRVMASWNDGTAIGPMKAYLRAVDGDTEIGEFRLDVHGGQSPQLLPTDGSEFVLDMSSSSDAWWEEQSLFFDVPLGASSLAVTVGGDGPMEASLIRVIDTSADESSIDADGGVLVVSPVAIPAGQTRTLTVASPTAVRWFVRLKNGRDARNRIRIRSTLQGPAPRLLPGSYFNPSQPGHGLLLYPAGSQWAGLWYTYDLLGRPTWYYLQAPQPGADGVWRAPMFRDTWEGDAARHVQVGRMTVTPISDRHFTMSYHVDGLAGSQPMTALGRGCPSSGGAAIDISSHWFDPARAGNGYSVQTWPDGYQFVAAFTYDTQGYPLFLAAERGDLGGSDADLALEYLDGACPVCNYHAPVRMPAGTLRRTLSGGTLETISLDIDYEQPAPLAGRHTVTVTDRVQLLGGAGTTQGCLP